MCVGGQWKGGVQARTAGRGPFLEDVRFAGSALITSHGFSRNPGK